jgi:hypothetical protein
MEKNSRKEMKRKKIRVRQHRRKKRSGGSSVVRSHLRRTKRKKSVKYPTYVYKGTYKKALKLVRESFPELNKTEQKELAKEFYNFWQERVKKSEEILIKGQICPIDRSISTIIQNLNDFGFFTYESCSGLKAEHEFVPEYEHPSPHISFDLVNLSREDLIIDAIKRSGWNYRYIDYPFVGVKVISAFLNEYEDLSDDEIRKRFKVLKKELTSLNSKQIFK